MHWNGKDGFNDSTMDNGIDNYAKDWCAFFSQIFDDCARLCGLGCFRIGIIVNAFQSLGSLAMESLTEMNEKWLNGSRSAFRKSRNGCVQWYFWRSLHCYFHWLSWKSTRNHWNRAMWMGLTLGQNGCPIGSSQSFKIHPHSKGHTDNSIVLNITVNSRRVIHRSSFTV